MAIAAKAFAAALVYAFFVVVPSLVKPHWTEFVEFFGGELGIFTKGLTAVHCAVLLTGNAMFVFLYFFQIPFFEQFKISPKPWNFSVKSKREDTKTLIKLSIGLTVFNNLFIAFPLSFLNYYSVKAMGGTADLESFPSSLELLKSILFAMVVEDAAFYTSHRTLHSFKALYANVHKLHHRYETSFRCPVLRLV
jgi:sterol desaturase/sphingolipid hydroxylase (fatty acid hydroxylase superfamily)